MGIGDWGLGIWAQSPIPNPQSPLKYFQIYNFKLNIKKILIFSRIQINSTKKNNLNT